MRKLISFILIFVFIVLTPFTVNAGGMEIIQRALSHNNQNKSVLQYILEIINPKESNQDMNSNSEKEVKIVTNKEELKEVEKDEKLKSQLIGIDVSKWNGYIDWKEVKSAGVEFAIIRAGYGQNTVDYQFKKNIQGCIENDIYVGIYWFSYAYNEDMAIKEANKCLDVIEPYKDDIKMPIFFDFEYDSVAFATRNGIRITKSRCTSITYAFCRVISKSGYDVGIYTNIDFSENYYTKEILNSYNVWIADWSGPCSYDGKYLIWQYTDNGRVKGIKGKVDMDRWYGDNR